MRTVLSHEEARNFCWQDSQLDKVWGVAVTFGRSQSLLETANLKFCNEIPEDAFPPAYGKWVIAAIFRELLLKRDIHGPNFLEKLLSERLYMPDRYFQSFSEYFGQGTDVDPNPFAHGGFLYPAECGEDSPDSDGESPEECAHCQIITVETESSQLVQVGSPE